MTLLVFRQNMPCLQNLRSFVSVIRNICLFLEHSGNFEFVLVYNMMKSNVFPWWFLWGLLFVIHSCSDDAPSLSVNLTENESISLGAEMGAEYHLSFSAGQNWTARSDADWLEVSPESGTAGEHELALRITKPNDTGASRTTTLTLVSGTLVRQIKISQDEYIAITEPMVTLAHNGGIIKIHFFTSLSQEQIGVFSSSNCNWLVSSPDTRAAEDVQEWIVTLYALPNETYHSRTTTIYFGKLSDTVQGLTEGNLLATATITQAGLISGESTDYSQDKEVRVIQTHTAGTGIPLVLMGDGFIDKEIANGYYDQVMDQAVENLFTEEPIRSLRDYFDIYAVTAVSPVNVFDNNRNTTFECWLEGGYSTLVEGNYDKVLNYIQEIEGIDIYTTQAVVLLNTDAYAGTNYFYTHIDPKGRVYTDFSIAYCPVIESLESEDFRRVMVHEVVGHGIGKLQDEYSYEENGAMPDDEIAAGRQEQREYGWWMNVDFTDNPQAVLWSSFLSDPAYNGQGLDIFEGACTYWTGAYRSTEESMMRSNILGFNAPSRLALYNNVIRRGEGRTSSLEEFVSFDLQTYTPSITRAAAEAPSRPFARPRVIVSNQPFSK